MYHLPTHAGNALNKLNTITPHATNLLVSSGASTFDKKKFARLPHACQRAAMTNSTNLGIPADNDLGNDQQLSSQQRPSLFDIDGACA